MTFEGIEFEIRPANEILLTNTLTILGEMLPREAFSESGRFKKSIF